MTTDSAARKGQVILLAIFFLFFIQHWARWTESIYRFSLVKLSSGSEMFSLLFILSPLVLLLFSRKTATRLMPWVLAAFLILRVPEFGLSLNLMTGQLGAGLGLVLVAMLLSGTFRMPGATVAMALGMATLTSIALRAWGSSIDLSMTIPGSVIALGLVFLAAYLLLRAPGLPHRDTADEPAPGMLKAIAGMLGIFANLTLVYLAFSSPAVMSAWTGADYFLILPAVVTVWSMVLVLRPDTPPRGVLVAGNLLFTVCIAGTLYAHTPAFPATLEASGVTIGLPTFWSHLPLYLACLLSPVVYLNAQTLVDGGWTKTPRGMIVPVTLGGIFMMAMTLMLIYSNVWGYVGPLGEALRGKFYLPFLITGVVSTVAIALVGRPAETLRPALSPVVPMALAALAILGAFVKAGGMADATAADKRLTVLTYNMQQGSAEAGDANWQAQLDFIRAVNPDLIGLQESDSPRPSGGNVDPSRYFADALGYHRYFGPATVGGTYGTAILSRFPLENPRSFYTYSDKDEIATAVVEVDVAGRRMALFNSHPAGSRDAKQAHVDALVERAQQHDHVIAVGDYNFRQDSPWYAHVTAVLKDCWLELHPDATGPRHESIGWSPTSDGSPLDMTRRIDHVFVSDDFNVEEAWYVPAPESETDHPAHWVVLTWE